MKKNELAAQEKFLTGLQQLADYLVPANARADAPESTCRCVFGRAGRWVMAAPCTDEELRPEYCRAQTHQAVRIWMMNNRLPQEQLSDRQLDHVVPQLADLGRRAPELTIRQFVIELQKHLRASLAPLAAGPRP